MVPRCSVGISNVKVDARHDTSARRLPHAVSKAPLNGKLTPFLPCEGMSRCRGQRLYARGKRGYDTSPVDRNLKEKRGSSFVVVVDEVWWWWWHVCFHACTGMPPRTPSCRHVGVPDLRPSLCRIALRGNGVEHAPVRDVAAAVDGFPPHVPLVLEVGGWGGWAVRMEASRFNCQVDITAVGGERLAGMQSSSVIAGAAAGLCCRRRQWEWRLGGRTDWVGWLVL